MCGHFMDGKHQAMNVGTSAGAFTVGQSVVGGLAVPSAFTFHQTPLLPSVKFPWLLLLI